MAELIQYLYEYEKGERVRNLGFMKVEKQMDKSVISLFAKQVDEIKGILFEREDGTKYMAAWESCIDEMSNPPCIDEAPREEEVEEYITSSTLRCEKIKRQDLSRLPRTEWNLANNSFLLHGYYTYHHLLYIEDDGKRWIGVPGIFHEKEEMAAKAFGFTEFRRWNDVEVKLETEERNIYEDFGYWCRQVNVSKV